MTSPDRPVESPAELLERAAVRLEELAHWATPLPWGSGEELTATLKILGTDAAWIAAMSPAVAAPLASWLRATARYVHYERGAVSSPENGNAFFEQKYGGAFDFAKQVLGEP